MDRVTGSDGGGVTCGLTVLRAQPGSLSNRELFLLQSGDSDGRELKRRMAGEIAARARFPSAQVRIINEVSGRPVVRIAGCDVNSWNVSLSYTRGTAWGVFAEGSAVGLDVEWVDDDFDWQSVAAGFFPPREQELLQRLAPEIAREGFFKRWTEWEAALKLRSRGFSEPVMPLEEALRGLQRIDLHLPAGFVGTVALS